MKAVYSREPRYASEHESAIKEYRRVIWDNLNRFHSLTSKARWLVSERSHQELDKLYGRVVAYDAKLKVYSSRLHLTDSESLPGLGR
jgi:hypothetical protein